MRRVSEMTNGEQIGHEVVGGLVKLGVKLGVTKSGVMKSGVTWHHLPN